MAGYHRSNPSGGTRLQQSEAAATTFARVGFNRSVYQFIVDSIFCQSLATRIVFQKGCDNQCIVAASHDHRALGCTSHHVCYPFALQQDPLDIPPLKVEDAKPRGVTVAEERVTKRMERKAGHQVRLDDTFYPTFLTPLPALVYRRTTRLFSWHLSLLPPAHLHHVVAQGDAL